MKQKYEEFRKKCYEKYQLNWMLSHGYSLQDLIDAMNEKYIEDDSREYTTPGCYYEDVLDNDGFHGELFHYYDAFNQNSWETTWNGFCIYFSNLCINSKIWISLILFCIVSPSLEF